MTDVDVLVSVVTTGTPVVAAAVTGTAVVTAETAALPVVAAEIAATAVVSAEIAGTAVITTETVAGPPGPPGDMNIVAVPYDEWPPASTVPDTLYLRLAP